MGQRVKGRSFLSWKSYYLFYQLYKLSFSHWSLIQLVCTSHVPHILTIKEQTDLVSYISDT